MYCFHFYIPVERIVHAGFCRAQSFDRPEAAVNELAVKFSAVGASERGRDAFPTDEPRSEVPRSRHFWPRVGTFVVYQEIEFGTCGHGIFAECVLRRQIIGN